MSCLPTSPDRCHVINCVRLLSQLPIPVSLWPPLTTRPSADCVHDVGLNAVAGGLDCTIKYSMTYIWRTNFRPNTAPGECQRRIFAAVYRRPTNKRTKRTDRTQAVRFVIRPPGGQRPTDRPTSLPPIGSASEPSKPSKPTTNHSSDSAVCPLAGPTVRPFVRPFARSTSHPPADQYRNLPSETTDGRTDGRQATSRAVRRSGHCPVGRRARRGRSTDGTDGGDRGPDRGQQRCGTTDRRRSLVSASNRQRRSFGLVRSTAASTVSVTNRVPGRVHSVRI